MASHETVRTLNTTDRDAHEKLTGSNASRAPVRPYHLIVSVCRIKQVWLNALVDPGPIPPAVDYASVIESDVPLVVQYLRRDSRLAKNALVSTIAYACNEEG